jgi:hypothetical protein
MFREVANHEFPGESKGGLYMSVRRRFMNHEGMKDKKGYPRRTRVHGEGARVLGACGELAAIQPSTDETVPSKSGGSLRLPIDGHSTPLQVDHAGMRRRRVGSTIVAREWWVFASES